MSTEYEITETLDVQGLNCPMPVVKTKEATDGLAPDEILEVLATDPGSLSDIEGWANSVSAVELLGQEEREEDGETVYKHYVRMVN